MTTLQSAKTMASVSREASQKFSDIALESVEFKKLIRGIEEAAEQGSTKTTYRNKDELILLVFKKQLEKHGYNVHYSFSPIEPIGIKISWDIDDSDIVATEESEA